MEARHKRAGVLIVDDTHRSRFALELTLQDVGCDCEIVTAESGERALELVAKREFAVVLLDVKMPGMNGLETARHIRSSPLSRNTPIIFITAFSDEMQTFAGYSLGAVDYITTPIISDVLRAKVRVFVELYDKTTQVQRQAERLANRARQFQRLTRASLMIHSSMSMDEMLHAVVRTAGQIVAAHRTHAFVSTDENGQRGYRAVSGPVAGSNGEPASHHPFDLDALRELFGPHRAIRHDRIQAQSQNPVPTAASIERLELIRNGCLGVSLVGRDGEFFGAILATDKRDGEFDDEDEALLIQLAQITSIAIENSIYCDAREANHAKDEFLARLSHELRTPLNSILGWVQLLRQSGMERDDVVNAVTVIERNATLQSRMIEDLLDISRITGKKLQLDRRPIDISQTLNSAADALRPNAESKDLSIEIIGDASHVSDVSHAGNADVGDNGDTRTIGNVTVAGDEQRLQQVFLNLLSNAVKYTPNGGRVSAECRNIDGKVVVRVTDTGRGIPPDAIDRIFDSFQQLDGGYDRLNGGLGIGLTIVRHLVELHNGTVRAESDGSGAGSTFTVELPGIEHSEPTPQNVAEDQRYADHLNEADDRYTLAGTRILIADDEADGREVLAKWLRMQGAEVDAVASADEVLQSLDKRLPNLLITDIAMPGGDGYALVRKLRSRGQDSGGRLPAIALSAYACDEERHRSIREGFDLHIAKPVDLAELMRGIRNTMAGQTDQHSLLQAESGTEQ